MEFNFNSESILNTDQQGFVVLDGTKNYHKLNQPRGKLNSIENIQFQNCLYEIIDKMGQASSKAQNLKHAITSGKKLFSSENRLYLKVQRNKVIGLLKVGKKHLFIRNETGQIREITPLCVLDFYVHESQQRNGQGKLLFEKMLLSESISPHQLAYDRPSEKLIAFIKKHYKLQDYVPQNNNFVVFKDYFNKKIQKTILNNIQNLQEKQLEKSQAKQNNRIQKYQNILSQQKCKQGQIDNQINKIQQEQRDIKSQKQEILSRNNYSTEFKPNQLSTQLNINNNHYINYVNNLNMIKAQQSSRNIMIRNSLYAFNTSENQNTHQNYQFNAYMSSSRVHSNSRYQGFLNNSFCNNLNEKQNIVSLKLQQQNRYHRPLGPHNVQIQL